MKLPELSSRSIARVIMSIWREFLLRIKEQHISKMTAQYFSVLKEKTLEFL